MTSIRWSRRARAPIALLLLFGLGACGGGGAMLPTEVGGGGPPADDGTVTGGDDGVGGGTGGEDGAGGKDGSGGAVDTVVVLVGETGFQPSTVTIRAGSSVVWKVIDNHHDVTFVDDAPAGGDVAEIEEGESAIRTFGAAGTYRYYCARHDGEELGTVIVSGADDGAGGDEDGTGGDPQDPPAAVTVRTSGQSFSPRNVTIGAGGTVEWQISGDRHNVTFTGAAPPDGNVPDTDGATVSRTFPATGRYDYFCTRHAGMTGAVTVQ